MSEGTKPERKRLDVSNLESAIDKQIREAMERGDFDNLRGKGKPLNLARDPNVPEDLEIAFNLLKNAGFAPDWIETLNEVRATQAKIFAPLDRFRANPPANAKARTEEQTQIVEQFRRQATELNRTIDTFNLKAPSAQVHLRRIRVEYEVEKFLEKTRSE